MAHKTRCKRCGAYTPAGYTECQPKVVYHPRALGWWVWTALAMGVTAWGWMVAQVVMRNWPM